MRRLAVLLFALSLAACGNEPSEVGPGGVSAEDAKALDEAAAKLDSEIAGDRKAETPDKPSGL